MEDFSTNGDIMTVPAGAGYLGTQPTVLVSDIIPSGVQARLESITCRALDVDITQIRFALRRNGASPSLFLSSIPASMFVSTATLPMRETMPPGVVEIVAYNLSGTGLPNAGPAVSPLCQAGWYGSISPVPQPETTSRWMPRVPKRYWKVGLCLALSLGISHDEKSSAQSLVVPGSTSARSALPIACVNPTTFVLEACGGGGAGGGLTDAQLRATPVPVTIPVPTPVTGTFFQATQPVSGTFFQATQPVSGPLTDTELRASPVPITGTLTGITNTVTVTGTVALGSVGFTLLPFTEPMTPIFHKPLPLLVYNARMRETCRRKLCPPNYGGLR